MSKMGCEDNVLCNLRVKAMVSADLKKNTYLKH